MAGRRGNRAFKEEKPKVQKSVKEEIKAVVFNCNKVRVRKSPTTDEDNIITELSAGTEVVVLDASNPGWTKVAISGISLDSWIISDYLQPV